MEEREFRVYIANSLFYHSLLTVSQVDVHIQALVIKLPTYKI